MALLSLRGVRYSIGGPALLDGVQLNIESSESVCLVGRNGEGKSTLMRLIAGQSAPEPIVPDGGDIIWQSGARGAFLPQVVPPQLDGRAFDIIAQGLPDAERDQEHRVATYLTQLKIDGDQEFKTLSGGMQRRVMLARALASDADLLLLDEPTNHLDIESIAWLEEYLKRNTRALLFVTHDRAFLRSVATRIVEIDRGKLASFDCAYDTYLERKNALLESEFKQQADFDKKLAQEEVWIRKGVKARTTRNEGRVRALQKLREERSQRRNQPGTTRLGAQDVEKSGHLVIEAHDVGFGYGDKPLIQIFSTTVLRGDKVGILGPNGSGKTTLLKLMLGHLTPLTGKLKMGTRLHLAYFDQNRAQLDEEQSVQWNVCGENSTVTINGERRHVVGYMQEWLFSPDRLRTPVKVLSGGERNRLLLARLFTQPMNLLVLDEPTNDLDMETLDVLEDVLVNFVGTLIVVSHDRDFLNNVVTSTLSPIGDGRWNELIGGYDDYLRQSGAQRGQRTLSPKPSPPVSAPRTPTKPRRMSFKEKQEMEALPSHIEKLEAEHEVIVAKMSNPEFYKGDSTQMVMAKNRLDDIARELESAFVRWEELEAVASASV